MSENYDNLLLEVLRRLEAKVARLTDRIRDLTDRVGAGEQRVSGVVATEALHHAATSVRLDRVDAQLDRIERRMGPTDRPGAG
jgi:hypothetical protein